MARDVQAKAVFEADTRDFKRGAQQAKKELKDFGKVGNDITSSLGDAFGVNTRKLEEMSNAAKQMGKQLSESGNAGVAAFGKMLQSIDAAKVALAGIGIGAAVGAFKLLNAEAENFKNTVAGANIEMATATYISTYAQVMHDFNAETAKSVAEFESEWQKGFARFRINLQQNLVNGLTGNAGLGQALAGPVLTTIFGGNGEQQDRARANAEDAERLHNEIYEIQRKINQESVNWLRMETQIAEYRRIMKDDSYTVAQQQEALANAQALIKRRYEEEYNLRTIIAAKAAAISALASDDVAAEDAKLAKAREAENVKKAEEAALTALVREQNSLTNAAQKEADERAKSVAAAEAQAQAMAQLRAGMAATNLTVSGESSAALQGSATTMQIGAVIKPTYDPKEITDISKEIASLVEQGIASVSESIGSLIGDLATGGDAWKNFSSSALSAFGDMAVSVGKMAIATGVATLGIKAALESLNGYVAIAAGAALVALGSAVKSGLGNIASGNYSASGSVAAASYGNVAASGGGYATSSIKVELSGKLTAKGSDLEYVLNENNKRRNTVT